MFYKRNKKLCVCVVGRHGPLQSRRYPQVARYILSNITLIINLPHLNNFMDAKLYMHLSNYFEEYHISQRPFKESNIL